MSIHKTNRSQHPEKEEEESDTKTEQEVINTADNKDTKVIVSGKMMIDEQNEAVPVTLSLYLRYFEYCGGAWFLFKINMWCLSFSITKVISDFIVGDWAD